jgi:hypothetical protein
MQLCALIYTLQRLAPEYHFGARNAHSDIGDIGMALTLKLNDEQTELMRNALLEYQRSIRQQERYHCSGPSAVGIGLCRRRLVLDSILNDVEDQESALCRSGKKIRSVSASSESECLPRFAA